MRPLLDKWGNCVYLLRLRDSLPCVSYLLSLQHCSILLAMANFAFVAHSCHSFNLSPWCVPLCSLSSGVILVVLEMTNFVILPLPLPVTCHLVSVHFVCELKQCSSYSLVNLPIWPTIWLFVAYYRCVPRTQSIAQIEPTNCHPGFSFRFVLFHLYFLFSTIYLILFLLLLCRTSVSFA